MIHARSILLTIVAIAFPADRQIAAQQEECQKITFDREAVFEEVLTTVSEHFVYQSQLETRDWLESKARFRSAAISAKTQDDFSNSINGLLHTLGTSHTYYYARISPKHYQLAGVFNRAFQDDEELKFVFEGVGIDTVQNDGRTFIRAVFDGFSAKQAGLKFGDELLTANDQPFHAIGSFLGMAGNRVELAVRRNGKELSIKVPVEMIDGRSMFEKALKSSVCTVQKNSQKVGYIHVWSYAGTQFQEAIRSELLWGKLADCDSLILDLRDGWGGADINYLNLFRKPIAEIESRNSKGESRNFTGVWRKPVVLVVNERSTSGKELFAYGFRKLGLGKIVGNTTAGAVVAGRCFRLSNGDLLYLAVSDIKVDGLRLEGKGVVPDIKIPRPIESAGENDPQLDAAIELLTAN